MKILLIEDDIKIINFLKKGLSEEGYTVDVAQNGEDGLYLVSVNPYDIVLLDIMLPCIDGFEVCQKLRVSNKNLPIIILTARDSLDDKINGLDIGANDYISKPFSFSELLARIRVQLRTKDITTTKLTLDTLELDLLHKKAFRDGKFIKLTAKEFALLEFLLRNKEKIISESIISDNLSELNEANMSNIINVYIYRLRNKIDKNFDKKLIKTVRGMGYILTSTNEY
jgi:DNA-binding response OmpR family regulator